MDIGEPIEIVEIPEPERVPDSVPSEAPAVPVPVPA